VFVNDVNLMAEKVTERSHTPGPWKTDACGGFSTVVSMTQPMRADTRIGAYGYDPRRGHCIGYPFIEDDGKVKRIDFVCFSHEDARLIAAAPDMYTILDELEEAFDKEIYPEQVKEDFDALDEREYSVTITAKQWRAISRALSKVQHGK
jgi:hypothetical protein